MLLQHEHEPLKLRSVEEPSPYRDKPLSEYEFGPMVTPLWDVELHICKWCKSIYATWTPREPVEKTCGVEHLDIHSGAGVKKP